eukprot:3359631-Ditylum_brightwellii.AAC.1
MEIDETEEGNIDAMVEFGAQALCALSFKPSSSKYCLSFLNNDDNNEGVLYGTTDQVELAQKCKEDEGVEVA